MRSTHFSCHAIIVYIRVSDWHYRWFMIANKVNRLRFKLFLCGGSQRNRYPRQEDLVSTEEAYEPAGLKFLKGDSTQR